jgi:hypothetical protein
MTTGLHRQVSLKLAVIVPEHAGVSSLSREFVWMDLLEKRAGKWVVVRSAGARVK